MPAFTAHDQFGKQVFRRLPAHIRKAAKADTMLFRLGFQGPDVLFYYRPLKKNDISAYGVQIHRQSGKLFFSRLCQTYRENREPALLSYALGACCHYTLDRLCHPYVNAFANEDGRAHQWLEANFDLSASERCRCFHPRYLGLPKQVNQRVLAAAYGITEKQAAESVRSFRLFQHILDYRGAVKTAENLLGKEGKFSSLSLPLQNELPQQTADLHELFNEALPLCAKLAGAVFEAAQDESVPLLHFEENFEGVIP